MQHFEDKTVGTSTCYTFPAVLPAVLRRKNQMEEGIPGYLVNSNQNNIIGVMKKNYKLLVSEIVIGKTVGR